METRERPAWLLQSTLTIVIYTNEFPTTLDSNISLHVHGNIIPHQQQKLSDGHFFNFQNIQSKVYRPTDTTPPSGSVFQTFVHWKRWIFTIYLSLTTFPSRTWTHHTICLLFHTFQKTSPYTVVPFGYAHV